MADPLAGQRQAINEDRALREIEFPDHAHGCPVKSGEIFKLRTCHIEIGITRRLHIDGRFVCRAQFMRSYPERTAHLLARGAGDGHGYTSDPDLAIAAQDDPDASTLASLKPLDNPLNLGPPPEPEAVPPHEVETLPSTVAARASFERQRRDLWEAYEQLPVGERLAFLRERVATNGGDAQTRREARRLRGMQNVHTCERRGRESNPQGVSPPG